LWTCHFNQETVILYQEHNFFFLFIYVQGSVYRKYTSIPFDIFPRCNITQFISGKLLYISGGISTHHQEHTQLYLQYLVLVKPLLLPAAIVEEFELV